MTLVRRDAEKIVAAAARRLAETKDQEIRRINEKVGLARLRFITAAPGQEMIYLAKEQEALAYLAACLPDPHTYPLWTNPEPDLAKFPLIAAEVGVTAKSAWELAQVWANTAQMWRAVAAQLEGARMRAIASIEACISEDEVAATVAEFKPI